MSRKELMCLRLLMEHQSGLYGSEMVELSGGYLGRGSIYTLLERLVDGGLVKEIEEPATLGLQRTRHIITDSGVTAAKDGVVPS